MEDVQMEINQRLEELTNDLKDLQEISKMLENIVQEADEPLEKAKEQIMTAAEEVEEVTDENFQEDIRKYRKRMLRLQTAKIIGGAVAGALLCGGVGILGGIPIAVSSSLLGCGLGSLVGYKI